MRRATLFILAGLVLFYWAWTGRPVRYGPGVVASDDPLQTTLSVPETFEQDGYRVRTLASFSACARVLSRCRYRFGRAADICPIDLALGWGPMSDESVLDAFTIWQSGRWYFWSAPRLPIDAALVTAHSANMHMIPANPAVRRALLSVRKGQVVRFEGALVAVNGPGGVNLASSLSRTDTGSGSCEVVWVREFEVVAHPRVGEAWGAKTGETGGQGR